MNILLIGTCLGRKCLTLFLLLSFYMCAVSQDIDLQNRDSTLIDHYENGRYKACKDLAFNILKEDSVNLLSIEVLAKIFESELNVAKAIKYNTLRYTMDTTNFKASKKLGQLYAEAEIFREAEFFYHKALAYNPSDVVSLKGLIEVYINEDDVIKADSLIKYALDIDRTNVGILLAKARLAYKVRDMASVIKALNEAGNSTNLSNYFLRMLGYAYLQQDSLDLAVRHLRMALDTDRNPEYTYYYLALAHERLGEEPSAIHYYEKAIDSGISKDIGNYYQRLGIIYVKNDKYKEAYPFLQKALEQERSPVTLYFMAITCDHRYKDKTRALGYFNELLQNPGNLDVAMLTYAKSRAQILEEERHQRKGKP